MIITNKKEIMWEILRKNNLSAPVGKSITCLIQAGYTDWLMIFDSS
jgi:hypothetical protein